MIEASAGRHAWIIISFLMGSGIAVNHADPTESAQNVVSTTRRPAC